MQKKTTYILFIVLILLLLTLSAKQFYGRKYQKDILAQKNVLEFNPETIDKIEIIQKNQGVILEKNVGWMVVVDDKSFPAQNDSIQNLLSGIKDAKIANVVSNSLNDLTLYGLDEENKITIKLSSKGSVAGSLILGKEGQSFNTVYALKETAKQILLLRGYSGNLIPKDWRDTTVVRLEKTSIQSIRFEYENTKESFEIAKKEDNTWILKDPKKEQKIEDTLIEGILNTIADITAESVADDQNIFKETKNKIIYTLTNNEVILTFGQELENGDQYVKTSDGYVYLLDKAIKEEIMLKRKNVLKSK